MSYFGANFGGDFGEDLEEAARDRRSLADVLRGEPPEHQEFNIAPQGGGRVAPAAPAAPPASPSPASPASPAPIGERDLTADDLVGMINAGARPPPRPPNAAERQAAREMQNVPFMGPLPERYYQGARYRQSDVVAPPPGPGAKEYYLVERDGSHRPVLLNRQQVLRSPRQYRLRLFSSKRQIDDSRKRRGVGMERCVNNNGTPDTYLYGPTAGNRNPKDTIRFICKSAGAANYRSAHQAGLALRQANFTRGGTSHTRFILRQRGPRAPPVAANATGAEINTNHIIRILTQ